MTLLRRAVVTAACLTAALIPAVRATAAAPGLPLGDPDLAESRGTEHLAAGVTLTRIIRGTGRAPRDEITTTTRGPWSVNVLTIDPRRARGHLEATFGPDLARAERTTDLMRLSGALAGVNGSFFTFTANRRFPGDPVGLGLYDGRLLSEPTTDPTEADLVVAGDRVHIGPLRWSGMMRNRLTGDVLALKFLDHPPVVPAGCADLPDPTQCAEPGDVVQFTPDFGATTPPGAGVEVVLDSRGCVVRTTTVRGTHLKRGQTSLQATGHDTVSLLAETEGARRGGRSGRPWVGRVASEEGARDIETEGARRGERSGPRGIGHARGCLSRRLTLTDEDGNRVPLRRGVYGVNGRFRLVADGAVVVPDGSGSFFGRNPRTIAGVTRDHRIVLATIDGRSTASVGATLAEAAAVARALGMRDAVNLDGGGSTTMSVRGALVNHPSRGGERAVGDALVYVP